jgi:pimeloyl-ACP methyl ester carboxylesterase
LLHGGPDLSDYLEGFGDLLAEQLGGAWSVVRYQQRGLSPSTTKGPFTVEQEIRDVLTVCDSLDGDAIWMLGHSWGGHLAMHVLVAAADRFRGAVIIDPLGVVADGGRGAMFEHFVSRLTSAEAAEWTRLEKLSTTRGLSPEQSVAQDSILWPYYFSDPESAPPVLSTRRGPGDHRESIAEHFEMQTLLRGLPSASTPTLFLAGIESPIPHEQSSSSAELMPEAEVVLLPTGHFPWLECPTETVELVTAFLSRT